MVRISGAHEPPPSSTTPAAAPRPARVMPAERARLGPPFLNIQNEPADGPDLRMSANYSSRHG